MIVVTQVLNKILQTKDISIVRKNGLTEAYFEGFANEFNFIWNHYDKHGNVPDLVTFLATFPNFEVYEVYESDEYLLDKLYEEYGYHRFVPVIKKVASLINSDSREAYNYLKEELNNLKPHSVCTGVDIVAEAKERYDLYANRNNNPEIATIKTGLPELDDIFGGWEMGDELVTIVARTNAGKSWILLKFLVEAWKQGKKVGLYSGEMNHVKLGYRFDALFEHFSNRCLSIGAQLDGYKEYIDELVNNKTRFNIITQKEFGGRPTVRNIRNYVEMNEIDILGIDQYSLMDDYRSGSRDQARMKLSHISEDLFLLSSEYKIPILGLAQANRESLKKENDDAAPGLENIKESDDIAHNSSKAIGMKQGQAGLILDIIKNREGKVGDKLIYSWDIDTGHFSYIPSSGDAARPEIRQAAQQKDMMQKVAVNINPF